MRLWDPVTGDPAGDPLTGHTRRVAAVAFGVLPDGRPARLRQRDGTVRLWDPATGDPGRRPADRPHRPGGGGGVRGPADGRPLLASGSGDGTVRLWDPATGAPVGDPLTGHTGMVAAVAFGVLPDGRPCSPPAAGTGRCGCGTRPPATRPATR